MQSTQLTPFCFGDNLVRVVEDENGEPWFVAKDVCKVLELENVTKALYGLDEDEKITLTISNGNPRAGIPNEMNLISESGLYALVFRSRKPEAKAFSKWVRSEVLPALRKTGRYAMSMGDKPALPPGVSRETRNFLRTFSGPRIALTERVLHLAELIGLTDSESVAKLFDIYVVTFFGRDNDKPVLPQAVENAVWNDIGHFLDMKNCGICRKARLFVFLLEKIKKLNLPSGPSHSLRNALLEHISENYE